MIGSYQEAERHTLLVGQRVSSQPYQGSRIFLNLAIENQHSLIVHVCSCAHAHMYTHRLTHLHAYTHILGQNRTVDTPHTAWALAQIITSIKTIISNNRNIISCKVLCQVARM